MPVPVCVFVGVPVVAAVLLGVDVAVNEIDTVVVGEFVLVGVRGGDADWVPVCDVVLVEEGGREGGRKGGRERLREGRRREEVNVLGNNGKGFGRNISEEKKHDAPRC